MLFCEKHFEYEFLKVERWIKFIGIPTFTILAALFLTPYPFNLISIQFLAHFILSFVGVIASWISIRALSNFFRKHCRRIVFGLRLAIQILISCVISISITLCLYYAGDFYFTLKPEYCDLDLLDLKNLILTVILLTFLINTIYEGYYLFLRLSETALETERYKKESIEAQYQNLTSRLNPHFLFNSLNTLTTIVEEDTPKAVAYIQELSVVYRYVLNSQKNTWIDLPSELKFTHSYITLLKMRFEEDLVVELDICENHISYYILPLTVQLLIENAVKHNEISSNLPLVVKILCNEEQLVVSNNKQKRTIMPSTTKVGLHNISERYRFLVNKDVIIEDTDDSFVVRIPLVKRVETERVYDDYEA
ncbi:MAG: histidine kinase [Bacteroidales bacterium]|nr:histidine kinase [Bacteroidales bacterium]